MFVHAWVRACACAGSAGSLAKAWRARACLGRKRAGGGGGGGGSGGRGGVSIDSGDSNDSNNNRVHYVYKPLTMLADSATLVGRRVRGDGPAEIVGLVSGIIRSV